MVSMEKTRKLYRWYLLTGAYFMGSIMMYSAFFIVDPEDFCKPSKWQNILIFGLTYLFIWGALLCTGHFLKGEKIYQSELFEDWKSKPLHQHYQSIISFWSLIIGLVITFFYASIRMNHLVRQEPCLPDKMPALIWRQVYPGLSITLIVFAGILLYFKFFYKNTSGDSDPKEMNSL